MELIYLWISKYKNIQEQGFKFSSKYKVEHSYINNNHTLSIVENNNTSYKDLFGKQITNITAIVGENGAGKTSLLECLSMVGFDLWRFLGTISYSKDGWGYSSEEQLYKKGFFEFIIAFEDSNNNLIINSNIDKIDTGKECKYKCIEQLTTRYLLDSSSTFHANEEGPYGGGHKLDQFNVFDESFLTNGVFLGTFINSYIGDINRNTIIQNKYIDWVTTRGNLVKRNLLDNSLYNIPIDSFVDLKYKLKFMQKWKSNSNELKFPAYVNLGFYKDYEFLKKICKDENVSKSKILNLLRGFKDYDIVGDNKNYIILIAYFYFTAQYIYEINKELFLNKILEIEKEFEEEFLLFSFYKDFSVVDKSMENSIKKIEAFFIQKIESNNPENNTIDISVYKNLFNLLAKWWHIIKTQQHNYLSIKNEQHLNLILAIMELPCSTKSCNKKGCLLFKENTLQLSFYMEPNEYNEWRPSTGETILLTQLSRIFQDNIVPSFVIIDECDLGLHPDWQAQYLKILLEAINTYAQAPIHLILTTHSPFVLSDIPLENVLFLKKNDKGFTSIEEKALEHYNQTFAANIHQLLSQSFFMKEGLIGAFAKQKVSEVLSILNQEKDIDWEYCHAIINLIGEPILKYKLQQKYNKVELKHKGIALKISELEAEIERLKNSQ